MHSTNCSTIHSNSNQDVFFDVPQKLIVDEDAKTRYSTSRKIEVLMEELIEKGPLVALGHMGPRCYSSPPFQLKEKFRNQPIFGWKPGTRTQFSKERYAIVLGARKVEGREYVYFRLSNDHTSDKKTFLRDHRPTDDTRVFISSHQTFCNYLIDLYPPAAIEKTDPNFVSKGSMKCSQEELKYVLKLLSFPLESILREREKECRAIGQEIFDTFKKANEDQSIKGKEAVVRVCNALAFCAKDGKLRKQYVEYAWEGVGDETWRWRH